MHGQTDRCGARARSLPGSVLLLLLSRRSGVRLRPDGERGDHARLINHARTRGACTPSGLHAALDKAALAHSRDMMARDYFSHSSYAAPGLQPGTRRRVLHERLVALDGR